MSEQPDEGTFTVKAGRHGHFIFSEDVTFNYPIHTDRYNGATGIRTRITSWRDRDEIKTTFPDGRETFELVRVRGPYLSQPNSSNSGAQRS